RVGEAVCAGRDGDGDDGNYAGFYNDGSTGTGDGVAVQGEGDGSGRRAAAGRGVDHGHGDGSGGGDIAGRNRGGDLCGADERSGLSLGAEIHGGGRIKVCAVDCQCERCACGNVRLAERCKRGHRIVDGEGQRQGWTDRGRRIGDDDVEQTGFYNS